MRTTASETCSFTWATRFYPSFTWATLLAQIGTYAFSFCTIIYIFVCRFSLYYTGTAIIRSSSPMVSFKKGVLTNFEKFTRKHLHLSLTLSKKRFRHRCFLAISEKSLTIPSYGCSCINTHSVYCPIMTFLILKNDVTHFFRLNIFSP